MYDEFITMIKQKFELGDDGHQDCTDFIGIHFEFNANRSSCIMTQPQKISELVSSSGLDTCRPSYTPGIPNALVSDRDCPDKDDHNQLDFMKDKPYRSRIGQLLWLSRTTFPAIAYQVNALARVAHNPGKAHWDATTKLIRYVSHHRNLGLVYTRHHRDDASAPLCLWSDATWAPDYGTVYDNYRSTTGWCATAHDNLLSWTSHRQSTVAQSTSESEWHAAADAAKEAAYLKNLFYELKIDCPRTVPLKCDNQSTIKQSINQVDQRRCRHLGVRSHYLRQQYHAGLSTSRLCP